MDDQACLNTDRELWRGPDEGNGNYYADSVHVTEGGAIGMNVGGYVIVMRPREWHAACKEAADLRNKLDAAEIALENERERCAKIAEADAEAQGPLGCGPYAATHARSIARSIRGLG